MGPPELPGGNTGRMSCLADLPASLQWGRRNYPAETLGGCLVWRTFQHRFNGAAGITRRKHLNSFIQQRGCKYASMGPPELPGGNARPWAVLRQEGERASMGPPELPGGNGLVVASIDEFIYELQWGRRNYPAETRHAGNIPCVSYSVLQWGRRNYPAETILRSGRRMRAGRCFNGAAGITRRKLGGIDGRLPPLPLLQWGRRNYPAETAVAVPSAIPPVHLRFNGAAGITRRKRRRYRSVRGRSRRCFNGAAGITRRKPDRGAVQGHHRQFASMGPPELPGGNPGSAEWGQVEGALLQWGRRNYPAETSPIAPTDPRSHRALQWGRRNYPAETRVSCAPERGFAGASMGPPELPGGNRRAARSPGRRDRSFNGAAGITRRKRPAYPEPPYAPHSTASMGPPELPGGN